MVTRYTLCVHFGEVEKHGIYQLTWRALSELLQLRFMTVYLIVVIVACCFRMNAQCAKAWKCKTVSEQAVALRTERATGVAIKFALPQGHTTDRTCLKSLTHNAITTVHPLIWPARHLFKPFCDCDASSPSDLKNNISLPCVRPCTYNRVLLIAFLSISVNARFWWLSLYC